MGFSAIRARAFPGPNTPVPPSNPHRARRWRAGGGGGFDEEEEVTKESAEKAARNVPANSNSFVTPAPEKKTRGDAPRFPPGTRGGGLEEVCGAGQPDAAPDDSA